VLSPAANVPMSTRQPPRRTGLRVIALFELFKGVLLLTVGIGFLTLSHQDLAQTQAYWVSVVRADANSRSLNWLVSKVPRVTPQMLEHLIGWTFFYSTLLLIEGIGLLLEKRWATYLTIISTASFIPLELYELSTRLTVTPLVVLGINIAIVWYLARALNRASGRSTIELSPVKPESPHLP
jgi:uncharacterized membrane protein (DUF2068 family)